MNSPTPLRQALDQVGSLPPIPHIAQHILSLRISSDEGEQVLFQLIEQDPPILSKIIGLANSPLFGTSRRILRLHDAIAILGHKRVKMVALSFAMMSAMSRKPPGHLDIQGLWQHSVSIAMAMDTLARKMPRVLRPSVEELYLAGMLHDIGFLVLDYLDPELSDAFHERLATRQQPIEAVEAEMLATTHAELGAELGRHWGLPDTIVDVLRFHHTPQDAPANSGQILSAMINIAEQLLPTFSFAEPVQAQISDAEWQLLGISPGNVDAIITAILGHPAHPEQ